MIDIQQKEVVNQDGLYELLVNGEGEGDLRIISVSSFQSFLKTLNCLNSGKEREGACSCLCLLRPQDVRGQGGGGVRQERGDHLLPCRQRRQGRGCGGRRQDGNWVGTQDLQRCSARGSILVCFLVNILMTFSSGDYQDLPEAGLHQQQPRALQHLKSNH